MYAREDLPIFDFSAFHADAKARAELVAGIGQACTDIGFFYLKNFGIAPTAIAQVFAESRTFFALPQERKHELLVDRTNRGYDGPEAQSFHPGRPGDLKESFRFTAEPNPHDRPKFEAAWSFLDNQPNKWPAQLPGFREVMLSFLSDCGDLVDAILAAIEEPLGMLEGQLTKNHAKRNCTMRLLHYPAINGAVKDDQERCGEHTDWGTVTLLFQDGQGGLEVRRRTGEWISAPALSDCVLVNIGDQLQAWTGGRLVSTPHRVRAADSDYAAADRYSIALFCFADFGASIDFGDVRSSGEYVLSKLRATQKVGGAQAS
jgi:isopenicillin N synthase-like dioxygenase